MAIDKMEAIDDYTLKVTLKEPSPTFLNNLTNGTVSIIPKAQEIQLMRIQSGLVHLSLLMPLTIMYC